MLSLSKLITLFALSACSVATAIQKHGPACSEVSFNVHIDTFQFDLHNIDLKNILGSLSNVIFGLPVQGDFRIAGRYCEPEVFNANRQNTLQFLVHGISYTREYWFDNGFGDQYSWANYASQQGYPTLSIDRLGNGASDHPDPILVVQYPAQVEVTHKILQAIRTGTGNSLPRTFNKIIYVGHSYGSIIGNALTAKYPTDVDSIVLTGYSSVFQFTLQTVLGVTVAAPAATVDPSRFGNLPAGYLLFINHPGVATVFFHSPDYDPAIENQLFNNRGTLAVGELASVFLGGKEKSFLYTGSVYVVTGRYDYIFCGGDCGADDNAGYPANTRENYPLAANPLLGKGFDAHIVGNAGHCWQFHYDGHDNVVNIHQWLAGRSF